jgi:cytochrome c-type biogenesis protein CcmF
MAVLFVGVAASSSFQHVSELSLSPGQSTRVGAYSIRYVRPTASVTPKYDPDQTGATMTLGALLDVTKQGRHVAWLEPNEGFYDSGEPAQGSVGHFIGGTAVSHVAMDAGVTRDVWSAIAPDISTPQLQRIVTIGNEKIPLVRPDEGLIAIAVLARAYLENPPPAAFRFEVSPLVMWIWIGGLIVFSGGLLALWPAGLASRALGRRRASVRSRTRLGSELEAEREAKYRELRELELDYATGKLSEEDYHTTDGALRSEALVILDRLEELDELEQAPAEAEVEEPEPVGAGEGR